jgi:DNA-directed RNA polymerase sigma subunit (sigma70/sigma32)
MEMRDPDDPIAMYLREAASVEPLTATEEAEIFRRLGASYDWDGDAEGAARRVIESHLRLIVSLAELHAAPSGVSVLDLIQEGNIGLLNAVKTFAKNPSGVFSAYAAAGIEGAILKAVADLK